jgi:hypothetical protein
MFSETESFLATVISDLILCKKCLLKLDPFQELSSQTRSFSDLILLRNCLFRLDPFQELSLQTRSLSGNVFSDWIFSHGIETDSYILFIICIGHLFIPVLIAIYFCFLQGLWLSRVFPLARLAGARFFSSSFSLVSCGVSLGASAASSTFFASSLPAMLEASAASSDPSAPALLEGNAFASSSKGEAAGASANIKESVDIFDRQWTPRAIVLSKSAI